MSHLLHSQENEAPVSGTRKTRKLATPRPPTEGPPRAGGVLTHEVGVYPGRWQNDAEGTLRTTLQWEGGVYEERGSGNDLTNTTAQ